MTKLQNLFGIAALSVALAACGGDDAGPAAGGDAGQAASGSAADATVGLQPITPDAGGQVVEVQMLTDEQGNNRFEPANFSVKKGDVVHFVLQSGVHNVNYPADKNPGKSGLPPAGPMLQAPGQIYYQQVTLEPGEYLYQCDPHAALGMVGTMTVTQ